MTTNRHYLPAEWENHSAVLISWPHADQDWAYMLDEVTQCYLNLATAISRVARLVIVTPEPEYVDGLLRERISSDRYKLVEMPTNDTWARDFGVICVRPNKGATNQVAQASNLCTHQHNLCTDPSTRDWLGMDYKFNGWGLKFPACHDNLITLRLFGLHAIDQSKCKHVNRLGFVLEGGSIDIDPDGVLLTTSECLLSPNRNGELSRQQIEQILTEDLGCSKVIWLEHGALEGDDTDSHVDTLARFVPGGIIAYTSCDREDDSHYAGLKRMEQELRAATDAHGHPYQLVSLPIPAAIYDEEGERLPATYANFLIINNTVFLPTYADEHYDHIAIEKIKAALPLYEVVTVDCRALIKQHGSLHCATMQIPDEIIL